MYPVVVFFSAAIVVLSSTVSTSQVLAAGEQVPTGQANQQLQFHQQSMQDNASLSGQPVEKAGQLPAIQQTTNPQVPKNAEKEIALLQFANGFCLGVLWSNSDNFTPVRMESCTKARQQQWWLDNKQRVRSQLNNSKCLQFFASTSINPAGMVFINECSDSPSQQWQFEAGQLVAKANGQILVAASDEEGSNLALVTEEDITSRQWQLKAINYQQVIDKSPATSKQPETKANSLATVGFTEVKFRNNFCLSVDGGLVNAEAPVVIDTCNGQPSQQWHIDPFGRLRPQHAVDMCLDPGKLSVLTASMAVMKPCNHQLAQRWSFKDGLLHNLANKQLVLDVESDTANARVLVRTKGSWQWQVSTAVRPKDLLAGKLYQAIQFGNNLCLDLYKASEQANKLQLWHCNERSIQLWRLDREGRLHPQIDETQCLGLIAKQAGQQSLALQTCNRDEQQKWRVDMGNIVSQPFPALSMTALGIHGGAKITVKPLPYWGLSSNKL